MTSALPLDIALSLNRRVANTPAEETSARTTASMHAHSMTTSHTQVSAVDPPEI